MTWAEFKTKWRANPGRERAASQGHFIDLCELLGHPDPNDPGSIGNGFEFEKGAKKTGGGDGWADVWKRHYFGWEYKGKHKNLDKAYAQLLLYRNALENPPLLVVSDIERIIVRTDFTNHPMVEHEILLDEIDSPHNLRILHALFFDVEDLRPKETRDDITQEAVRMMSVIATRERRKKLSDEVLANFLDRCVFCFFAEDIGLLPQDIFTNLIKACLADPEKFQKKASEFFKKMWKGGEYGNDTLKWFNGNLFEGQDAPLLTEADLTDLHKAGEQNWKSIDPRIFGMLFQDVLERKGKRAQLGAHYTKEKDIEQLLRPVLTEPLENEWQAAQQAVIDIVGPKKMKLFENDKNWTLVEVSDSQRGKIKDLLLAFRKRLATVRVLDPACGSGNFLYVALKRLKDLEKSVVNFAARFSIDLKGQEVTPRQLYGVEKSHYAWQLAQLTVWIAYLQWRIENGFKEVSEPVLNTQDTFKLHDAVLGADGQIPSWPHVDVIVSNPPFLGSKRMRKELGDAYVDALFETWDGSVARESDLCCYWFERARMHLAGGGVKRVGLLATQAIRGGANRKCLAKIKESGDIFFAVSDQVWYEVTGDAHVQISMVGFDDGSQKAKVLDGKPVANINSDLTSGTDLPSAVALASNEDICFMGTTKGGDFDIPFEKEGTLQMDVDTASQMLWDHNPHGRPNSDVLVPWVNGADVTGRSRHMWVIDFGTDASEADAARYHLPFEFLKRVVLPVRASNKRDSYKDNWWLHVEPRPALRVAVAPLARYVITGRVTKHRFFDWMNQVVQPDSATFAFARDDDYFFGVLHSRFHEVWALATGTQLREKESGFRYTPKTCFDKFPFPFGVSGTDRRLAELSHFATTGAGASSDPAGAAKKWLEKQTGPAITAAQGASVVEIARAALELHQMRHNYLNPPTAMVERAIEFPATATGRWHRHIVAGSVDQATGVGMARYSWLVEKNKALAAVPGDQHTKSLKKRTLTDLYNERPTWLENAHSALDEAVAKAYGFKPHMSDDNTLEALLALNLSR